MNDLQDHGLNPDGSQQTSELRENGSGLVPQSQEGRRGYNNSYQGIAPTIFDEPELRDSAEKLIYIFLVVNRDAAGVCPVAESIVAAKCCTSVRRLRKALDYYESIGKIEIGIRRSHIWLKSGIVHTLYKGKYSDQQMKNVLTVLKKWEASGVFQENFAVRAAQHVEAKYSIRIPYAEQPYIQSEAPIQTDSQQYCQSTEVAKSESRQGESEIPYKDIVNDLNKKAGTSFRHTSEPTQTLIRARWHEGFRETDFYIVHENKVRCWSGDTQYAKFLRPETLYAKKYFEGYLNEGLTTRRPTGQKDSKRYTSAGGIRGGSNKYANLGKDRKDTGHDKN